MSKKKSPSTAQRAHRQTGRELFTRLLMLALVTIALGAAYLILAVGPSRVHVTVPKANLPAYHVVRADELKTELISVRSLPQGAIRDLGAVAGKYTRVALPSDEPIISKQLLGTPGSSAPAPGSTVAVALAATPAMVMGGSVQPGDVVDMFSPSTSAASGLLAAQSKFENVLILDVKPTTGPTTTTGVAADRPFVIVIALPVDRRNDFITLNTRDRWVITRKSS